MESFSKSVKEELSKLNNLSDKKLVKYEKNLPADRHFMV